MPRFIRQVEPYHHEGWSTIMMNSAVHTCLGDGVFAATSVVAIFSIGRILPVWPTFVATTVRVSSSPRAIVCSKRSL